MHHQKGIAMRRKLARQMTVALVVCCAAVTILAQDVQYNYDRDAEFSVYKTYQWVERSHMEGNELVDKDIRRAIDGQLSQKGLQRVESSGDLHIQYLTAVDREKQVDAWTMGPRWSGMARANTSTIDVGTLIVNVYDPARKQLIWRGSARKSLDLKKDPDKNYKNLEKAVAKLLRHFPPNSKK
jgi:Domain of unknown function (DUF4136)